MYSLYCLFCLEVANRETSNFCSVTLPPVQPLSKDTTVAQRCFIVCSPHTLPVSVLKQAFCRFGNLIDVYLLSGRNCGYVKFSVAESAKQVRLDKMNYEELKDIFIY